MNFFGFLIIKHSTIFITRAADAKHKIKFQWPYMGQSYSEESGCVDSVCLFVFFKTEYYNTCGCNNHKAWLPCDSTPPNPSMIDVTVGSPSKKQMCEWDMLQSFGNLFIVGLIIFFMNLKEYNPVIIQVIPKCLNSNVCRLCMNSCPSHFWWRGRHARAEKRWHCLCACILKSKLDWHHKIELKIKFHL